MRTEVIKHRLLRHLVANALDTDEAEQNAREATGITCEEMDELRWQLIADEADPPETYGEITWTLPDVLDYDITSDDDPETVVRAGDVLTEEEAGDVLSDVEGTLQDVLIERGWNILGEAIEDAVKEKQAAAAKPKTPAKPKKKPAKRKGKKS